MSDYCQEASGCRPDDAKCALSIHTKKITDSCRDKDCIEDLRVYLTRESQGILDSAANAKVRCAELLHTAVDVSPVTFNRDHYCIDLTFYYRILADATVGTCRPAALCGLALFSKRCVLCGEHAEARIFSSKPYGCEAFGMPTAVVEVLDPMVLASRTVCVCAEEQAPLQLPARVREAFDDELVLGGEKQRLLVTLGQFSIIRLERDTQIVVPVLDYSMPTKDCCESPGCAEDPCRIFDRIPFPCDQFTASGCDGDSSCSCGAPYQTT